MTVALISLFYHSVIILCNNLLMISLGYTLGCLEALSVDLFIYYLKLFLYCVGYLIYYVQFIDLYLVNVVFYVPLSRSIFWICGILQIKLLLFIIINNTFNVVVRIYINNYIKVFLKIILNTFIYSVIHNVASPWF